MTAADEAVRRAADDLYAVAPADFVAARKRIAADQEDRAIRARIAALPKPVVAASLINAFVRSTPGALDRVNDIGAQLRGAEESGDAVSLRALASARRTAIANVVRAAMENAGSDVPGSTRDAVQASFQAAVLSSAAAAAIASGMLIKPLAPGDDPGAVTALPVDASAADPTHARADSASGSKPSAAKADSPGSRRARATAIAAVHKAESEVVKAQSRLADADNAVSGVRAERDQVRQRLSDLRDEISDLEERESELGAELSQAQRSRRNAAGAERAARTRASALRRKAT